MANNYVRPGESINFVNGASPVVSGQVVRVGNLLGVALGDIAANATGVVGFGVFTVPKVSAAVIAQGASVLWDASAAAFDVNTATPATGDVSGPPAVATIAAGNGATTVSILFTGVPGTVT